MQTFDTNIANVHCGAFANRFQAFQDLYVAG
jgi:hypothetical protein